MIKHVLYIIILFGITGALLACDSLEQPFVVRNDLTRPVNLQILSQSAVAGTELLGISPGANVTYKPELPLASGQSSRIFTDGFFGGRVAYIIVISDESGKELFRHTFPRDELIKHKFRLTVTGQGIQYSP